MIIKLFASIKEKLGKDQIIIEGDSLKNIEDIINYFSKNFDIDISNCMFACDLNYVKKDYKIKPSQEISVIPPVSGGSQNDLIEIKREQIVPENYKTNKSKQNGAELTFLGISREVNEGKKVKKLFYECYEEMAVSEIEKLIYATKEKYKIDYFVVVHRIEEVPPGEISLLITIASEHRNQSLKAMTEFINIFKDIVPIWKKEIYEDSSKWL
tara:strand:- start:346 stop:981 length:636 start_codon:yes stop_codon:yes gene_type:complete